MPARPPDSPLRDFLEALDRAGIRCILIGGMAAIAQGAPLTTIDYDLWVRMPMRAYVKLLAIVQRQGGTILARTLYELSDGRHVNVIFEPDGLRAFETEWPQCVRSKLDGADVRILPLDRIISSKKAAGRDKDLLAIPVLEKTLRVKARRRTRARRA